MNKLFLLFAVFLFPAIKCERFKVLVSNSDAFNQNLLLNNARSESAFVLDFNFADKRIEYEVCYKYNIGFESNPVVIQGPFRFAGVFQSCGTEQLSFDLRMYEFFKDNPLFFHVSGEELWLRNFLNDRYINSSSLVLKLEQV